MRAFTGLVDTNYILDAIRGSELLEVQVRLYILQHFLFFLTTEIICSDMYCVYTFLNFYCLNLCYREIMSGGAMIGQNGYFIKAVH
jgi:la-related protein 1